MLSVTAKLQHDILIHNAAYVTTGQKERLLKKKKVGEPLLRMMEGGAPSLVSSARACSRKLRQEPEDMQA